MCRAVFLDRDGVLNRPEIRNRKPYAPRRLEDFRLLPRAGESVRALKDAGYLVIVVTNQPDIGNGLTDPAAVQAMHEKLRKRVPVDEVRICPHRQDADCPCRKPRPGMLLSAAADWDIDLHDSFLVGDRDGDIVAGRTAGCYTILINRRYSEPRTIGPDKCVRSLSAAVQHILANNS